MGSSASSKYLATKHSEVIGSAAGSHDFYFICADRLREFWPRLGPKLPPHQELLKREGWLIKRRVDFYTLLKGGYDDMAMISHRWVTPAHPDPNNEQLAKIQEFLSDNPNVKMVWYDYACIPQGKRDQDQEIYFRECLNHISLLYLTLPGMIIYDKQYGSRFWCNFEMYLSLRKADDDKGIGPASDVELESQFHFYCVGSAQAMAAAFKAAEMGNWKDRSVSEAADLLRSDDILVTNRRDKDVQLEKLSGLERRIKKILVEKEAELQGMSRQRLKQLTDAKATMERLTEVEVKAATYKAKAAELKKALDLNEKALEETELEIAGMKELVAGVPDRQELDEEVKALEAFNGLEISVDPAPNAMNVWSTAGAFLAKLKSGKVVAWGDADYGGNLARVQSTLDADGLDSVWSTEKAFLAKLKSGKVVAWGDANKGGNLAPVQATLDADGLDRVWSTDYAFLAKLKSGKVVAWGNAGNGGNLAPVQATLDFDGLDSVWSTNGAFLAKLKSGKVVAWGQARCGGNLAPVQATLDTDGLDRVWSTRFAFLAKLKSGKVVAWGDANGGAYLKPVQATLDFDGLDSVWSTGQAFLAKLKSGKVVAWGYADFGGNLAPVQATLDTDGLDRVWSTNGAFLAKLKSGKVVAWGNADYGGNLAPVQATLDADGLDSVWSTNGAFLAKLKSGKVIAWGRADYGGNLAPVQAILDRDSMG